MVISAAPMLCELTLNGFAALEAISVKQNNPMSANRDGPNLGEGAGLFVLSRDEGPFRLAGWGESADGHQLRPRPIPKARARRRRSARRWPKRACPPPRSISRICTARPPPQ